MRTNNAIAAAMRTVIFSLCILAVWCTALSSQVPSQDEKIRIAVWALRDAYPGLEAAQDTHSGEWDYPRDEIKRIAQFMVCGMVSGYSFEYTPSDKKRAVAEYFQMEEMKPLGEDARSIDYTQMWVEDGKVWCYVEFDRTPSMRHDLEMWKALDNKNITGTGYASVTGGFDGIVEATRMAVKDAVREHYRTMVKNKPKSITGRVLIRNPPKVGISSGRYKIALDFFLETDTIEAYNVF